MTRSYFLGANSANGFFSLYDTLCGAAYLHIIKGGPGTGKSSFMRRIGQEAERRGLDVEYALCSGDPDSLDAVYIPSRRLAFVDGTAPHPLEPERFGVDCDYVNLGQFCGTPLRVEVFDYVNLLYEAYRTEYRRAYACLCATASLLNAQFSTPLPDSVLYRVQKRLCGILDKSVGGADERSGAQRRLFLSAVCCKGELRLESELNSLCKLCYVIDNGFGQADSALRFAYEQACRRGVNAVAALDPLRPERLTAVLLPEAGVAFADSGWAPARMRVLHFDTLFGQELQQRRREERKRFTPPIKASMALALDALTQAKRLHDELESVYTASMDFASLDAFTERYIQQLFKR